MPQEDASLERVEQKPDPPTTSTSARGSDTLGRNEMLDRRCEPGALWGRLRRAIYARCPGCRGSVMPGGRKAAAARGWGAGKCQIVAPCARDPRRIPD